jgi:hypothetical protein
VALRIILTLLMTAATAVIAGRRILWLVRLIRSGTAAPGRGENAGGRAVNDAEEVLGQTRLLKWSVPGLAHFLTFWGFVILNLTILEAYGALLISRDFAIPLIGRWQALGFLEDLMGVAVLVGLATFAVLRIRNAPQRKQRDSRFYGSHTGPAWVILGMITLVILTLFLLRGAQMNAGEFPFGESKWTFASYLTAKLLGEGSYNTGLATFFLLAQVAVVLVFLIIVTYSKHLHIATAPINVYFKRLPKALGALPPVTDAQGKTIDFMDVENLSEDTVFGKGKVEDFSWKAYLDFATCTECGRCQSQCPAWNTGKPLSPKLVIMDLRDHLFAKAPPSRWAARRSTTAAMATGSPSPATAASPVPTPSSSPAHWWAIWPRTASSTRTCCGPAPPAGPASSSARSISSTSTTSSTCAATRC